MPPHMQRKARLVGELVLADLTGELLHARVQEGMVQQVRFCFERRAARLQMDD